MVLENEAENIGFKWENAAQIHSECAEITVHLQNPIQDLAQESLQEEIGDLLHAVFSLCIFCKLSPHETLEKALTKFERRSAFAMGELLARMRVASEIRAELL